jgi:hypothetical protein
MVLNVDELKAQLMPKNEMNGTVDLETPIGGLYADHYLSSK